MIAVEAGIAAALWWSPAAGVTGPAWLLVAGLAGHGVKDLWQHRSHYVANTRWWPPFCLVVNWVAAAILVVLVAAGVDFHHCMCRNNTRFSRALRNKDAKYMQSGMT